MMSPLRDLALIIGTPLLILPAVLGLKVFVAAAVINKWVMALGAMGHHLPGMMRAYGDRPLFQRFKVRFIVAPLGLAGACVLFSVNDWHGMIALAYLWGVWHGLMQTHGFLRIYDAKLGSFARWTARLDFGMCFTWFCGGVFFSETRMDYLANMVSSAGGPLLAVSDLQSLRTVWAGLIAVTTVAFVINAARCAISGKPTSPVKILLLVSSIAWWWYANVAVENIILGLVFFEVFHDVQYLTIVWLFNRSRVDKDPSVGGFSRFLFRRSYGLVGLYLGMIVAYGSIGPLAEASQASDRVISVMAGLVTASALLHFYYDGFIWKMRDKQTREGLGLGDGAGNAGVRTVLGRPGLVHASKWLLVVIPVTWLGLAEARGAVQEVPRAQALTELSPTCIMAWTRLGLAQRDEGEFGAAADSLQQAFDLDPQDMGAKLRLSRTLVEYGEGLVADRRLDEARAPLQRAFALEPDLAGKFNNEGNQLMRDGHLDDASERLMCGILMNPELSEARLNLALILQNQGRLREALTHARAGSKLRPQDTAARDLVRRLEAALGE